jgi:hypothetical protein
MRIRYMIEYALRLAQPGSASGSWYQPIGVWAYDGNDGWAIEYLPEEWLRWCDARVYLCGFMERGERTPDDILERWAATIGTYTGDCSPICEIEASSADEVAARLLALLVAGERLGNPPLT